jgi:hypothetical protein
MKEFKASPAWQRCRSQINGVHLSCDVNDILDGKSDSSLRVDSIMVMVDECDLSIDSSYVLSLVDPTGSISGTLLKSFVKDMTLPGTVFLLENVALFPHGSNPVVKTLNLHEKCFVGIFSDQADMYLRHEQPGENSQPSQQVPNSKMLVAANPTQINAHQQPTQVERPRRVAD